MRIGVYSRDSVPGALDLCAGLALIGHEGVLRSAPDWGEGCREAFDAVALFGLQGKGRTIFDTYRAAGVPVVLIDYGYVRRTNSVHDWKSGHWQVSLDGLNRIPAFECPPDRFESLGVPVTGRGGDPDGYVLLCVQEPGDASHGMSMAELHDWCHAQAQRWPDLQIRPHPQAPDLDYGLPRCEASTLAEALAGARLVVTANSNAGHDALLAGVPVVGDRPAAWSELAGEELPDIERRRRYFERLAYGQWTWAEFRSGDAPRFLVEHILTGRGFEGVAPLALDAGLGENPDDAARAEPLDSQDLPPAAEAPKRRGRPSTVAA